MIKPLAEVTDAPRLTEHERKIIRIMNIFGYVDKYFINDLLCPGKSKRYVYDRRAKFKIFGIFQEFQTFFPAEVTSSNKELYWCVSLGDTGVSYALNFKEAQRPKRKRSNNSERLYHSCMLARSVMEMFLTLESKGFDIVTIFDESGEFALKTIIRPDATIIFKTREESPRYGAIYLEMERNYVDDDKINKKVKRYAHAIANKQFEQVVGYRLSTQRLVYVCSTENKAEDLTNKLKRIGDKGLNLVLTSYQNLCANHSSTMYTVPYSNELVQLTSRITREQANES